MYITGFHSIEEKVRRVADSKDKKSATSLTIFYSKIGPRVKKILSLAKDANIITKQVTDKDLDNLVKNLSGALKDHRGIVLSIEGEQQKSNIVDFDSWVASRASATQVTEPVEVPGGSIPSRASGTAPTRKTVLILDGVTDPHNIGAIIRSCDQFGCDLVILPEHGSAREVTENEVIGRASAGASAWVPVSVVTNLVQAAKKLKDAGFWIYGADAGGKSISEIKFPEKTAIVMGSEGSGISRLLEENCDEIVSIPTCGKIDSLNVSVAAGILLYERSRTSGGGKK